MIDRCDNPDNKAYHRYGGRGISVCTAWYSFYRFMEDLPDGFFPKADLDRIDNDGNYEAANVRWSTRADNCLNKPSTRMIEFNGRALCVSHWAKEVGIHVASLIERLDNWSLEDSLTLPKGTRLHNRWDGHEKAEKKPPRPLNLYDYNDHKYTMRELSKIAKLKPKLLRKRITERGWSVSRAVETGIL